MLNKIKSFLKNHEADAWVIYDFASTNPAFIKLFGKAFTTRKCFVIIDSNATNYIICHTIDSFALSNLTFSKNFDFLYYNTWEQLDDILKSTLSKYDTIMMEISENGLLPRASHVDYGTVCSIKRFVKNVVSSADMFQSITATFDGISLESHIKAAKQIDEIKDAAFSMISNEIKKHGFVSEYKIQQYICDEFNKNGMITDSPPIVAIGKNAKSPHYEPSETNFSYIKNNDLVLIDLWAKYNNDYSVFADITWMGFVGEKVPDHIQKAFNVLKTAIDKAIAFLEENLPKRTVLGYEVDDVCNAYITEQGYGPYILHRTGHSISIGNEDHGVGVNIDNFETHDTRQIIDNIAFSIEPGIYTEEFGIREEINIYIKDKKPLIFTKRQESILLL